MFRRFHIHGILDPIALVRYLVAVFLFWSALYLYMPTLPVYLQSKSENLGGVGLILSMYGLCQAVVRLPLGIASDWLGRRKPLILGGIVLAGLGAWMMGSAEGPGGLLVGRSITGLAASTWVPLVVAFCGLFPSEQTVRASAMLTMVGSIARVFSTAATGTLNRVGGYPLAFFVAAGAAALGGLVFLPAREKPSSPQKPSARLIIGLLTRRDVLIPSLLSAVTLYANWSVTFGFLPILARNMEAGDVTVSILMSMYFGVVILGNLMAATSTGRFGARTFVCVSLFLLSAGLGAASVAPNLHVVFLGQFLIGLSMGIGYPVWMGMSIQRVAGNERTTAMGIHQSLYAIGMFGGPILSGPLADVMGIRPMFAITTCICAGVGFLGYWGLQERLGAAFPNR